MVGQRPICIFHLAILTISLMQAGCAHDSDESVKIALNPWPGYEFLYLAKVKGFFKEEGLKVELVEMESLADVQRVFIQGRVDGMASTMIEVVQVAGSTQQPLSIILIPDYSFGGDVILTKNTIDNVSSLKGLKIGAEFGSLGMYILFLALEKYNLTLNDVEVINVEQLEAEELLLQNTIDAVVSYPPFSTSILRHKDYHEILSTKELPGAVIDTVSIKSEILAENPLWKIKFLRVWDKAIVYAKDNQKESYKIMSDREGMTADEFSQALQGIKLLNSQQSNMALQSPTILNNISKVCNVLTASNSISFKCSRVLNFIEIEAL